MSSVLGIAVQVSKSPWRSIKPSPAVCRNCCLLIQLALKSGKDGSLDMLGVARLDRRLADRTGSSSARGLAIACEVGQPSPRQLGIEFLSLFPLHRVVDLAVCVDANANRSPLIGPTDSTLLSMHRSLAWRWRDTAASGGSPGVLAPASQRAL